MEPTWAWLRSHTKKESTAGAARMVLGTFHRENPGSTLVPVPLLKVVKWLGVRVVYVAAATPQSASIDPTQNPPLISLQPGEEVHTRFSIAHELGHLMLHSLQPHDTEPVDPRQAPTKDYEANDFACELLMPAAWIQADVFVHNTDPMRIARKYLVSEIAATYRLKKLRLIP